MWSRTCLLFRNTRVHSRFIVGFVLLDSALYIIGCPLSVGHCSVCPSSIYGFCLTPWYLQTFLSKHMWIYILICSPDWCRGWLACRKQPTRSSSYVYVIQHKCILGSEQSHIVGQWRSREIHIEATRYVNCRKLYSVSFVDDCLSFCLFFSLIIVYYIFIDLRLLITSLISSCVSWFFHIS